LQTAGRAEVPPVPPRSAGGWHDATEASDYQGFPLATSLKGKTPGQTLYSALYAESTKADGLVLQTGRGEFKLNPKRKRE
jgi:hypothetical protein